MKIDLSRGQQRCAVGFTPSASLRRLHSVGSLRRLHAVTWRSYFDLDVEMRDGTKHCFSMIPSDEGRSQTTAAQLGAQLNTAFLSCPSRPRS
jgi:hypothetical protein